MSIQTVASTDDSAVYRVVVHNGRRLRRKTFGGDRPRHITVAFWSNYQHLKAQYFEALCQKNAAAVAYLNFVRSSSPICKPGRGVGVHGITMGITEASGQSYCYFAVLLASGVQTRIVISRKLSFSEAWQKAVNLWAEEQNVRPKDRDRVLSNSPGPEAFKLLRRQLNQEGYDIPPSALHHVFAEKRQQVAVSYLAGKETAAQATALEEGDIASWFLQETSRL